MTALDNVISGSILIPYHPPTSIIAFVEHMYLKLAIHRLLIVLMSTITTNFSSYLGTKLRLNL